MYPYPTETDKFWSEREQFISKLKGVQNYLKLKQNIIEHSEQTECLLKCDQYKNIFKLNEYIINNIHWKDDLIHYIQIHNYRPSDFFVDAIYNYQFRNPSNRIIQFNDKSDDVDAVDDVNTANIKIDTNSFHDLTSGVPYVKIDKNQFMIMDALMKHGGYTKKYIDKKKVYRYSEHAGILDFNSKGLDRIIISGKTSRVDKGDIDIFLPKNMSSAVYYEYLFHTHPPTPKPGGRAKLGILYEFPSISDLFHFMDHYNYGKTIGSLVIAPEGVYNIRKYIPNNKKITIDEDALFKKMREAMYKVQSEAIQKYGKKFSAEFFYSIIAQDISYISELNNILNLFTLHIDFYPRIKDESGNWIFDTIHLPITLK